MRTIIRYGLTGAAIYFGVNWVADNPKKVNYMRNQLNKSVDAGLERGGEFLEDSTK